MRNSSILALATLLLATVIWAREAETDRLKECGTVMQEILGVPDGIPQELLDRAECVMVFPSVKKIAVGIGGSYGRGALVCRGGANYAGPWGPPAMYALEGANIGFQLGGQATDYVMLVLNPKGAKSILSSNVKLGADIAASAGPKGRTASASTDVVMKAEILSYSRSRGLFAGISLEGSTLRSDGGANENLYGKNFNAREIIEQGQVRAPASAQLLISTLNKNSPKNRSDSK